MKNKILVIDDDFTVRMVLKSLLSKDFDVREAQDYNSAMKIFNNELLSLIILDINLNDTKNGLDILREIKAQDSTIPIMVLSNHNEVDIIVNCLKLGADEYLSKQNLNNYNDLKIKIYNCFKKEIEGRATKSLEKYIDDSNPLVFESKIIQQIIKDLELVGDMNILIEGETGVGKTPIAKHANTLAAKKSNTTRPFVRINCAGLSRERLQADLFGHKKGSFTGAISDNKGLVELAKDGDLFMDEIGDMDSNCQAELLTFLDSGEYRRVGDPIVRHSNCRIITATNVNLKDRVDKGSFRKDLYSRLAQYRIRVSPIRERKEDIIPIMEYYINKFSGFKKPYSDEALAVYMNHDWKEGNIRELRDAVKYMCVRSNGSKTIELSHINSDYYSSNKEITDINIDVNNMKNTIVELGYDNYISNIERIILEKLVENESSIRNLSKRVKVSDVTLGRKLRKYNIQLD